MPGGSFSQIAYAAMGLPGKYILDIFLSIMQYGFVVATSFFTIINLKNVVDGILDMDVPEYYVGKHAVIYNHQYRHFRVFRDGPPLLREEN